MDKEKSITRRDFLKLSGAALGFFLLVPEIFQNGRDFYPIYNVGVKSSLRVYPVFDGSILILLDSLLENRLNIILTDPRKVPLRALVLPKSKEYSRQISSIDPECLIGDPKEQSISDRVHIYSFPFLNKNSLLSNISEATVKLAVIKNPQGEIIPAYNIRKDNKVLFSGKPKTILNNQEENFQLSISVGATHHSFIAGVDIYSEEINSEFFNMFSFPYGIYGIHNLITFGKPNCFEYNLLNLISRQSSLSEYRYNNLCQFPFNPGYYQPQYGWINTQGFFGSEGFGNSYDQTLNLLGQGILNEESVGFMISGPWWFNQPNNPYAVNLSLKMLEKIGIKPISFFSCDTGGQTGFWYKKDNQWQFSHQGNFSNMQHTTLAMFGFC